MKVCLVLTHQCNLGCSYCYAGEKFKSAMSLETGTRALRLAFSRPGPIEVSFFGGEPMIAFDTLARLTRIAHGWAQRSQRDLRFQVTTNATILKDHHLKFLRHYKFFVALSVDGVEAEHDKHRPFVNGRGSGDLVWRNLERACEVLPDFRVLTVVRPDTLAGLPTAVERMYRLGVSRVSLLPDAEADWSHSHQQLLEVYGKLAHISLMSTYTEEPIYISPFAEQFQRSGLEMPGKAGCGFGSDELAVAPSGNFYPCARLVGPDRRAEVRIGNLDTGLDWDRVSQLQSQADESLSQCGSGGCQCLALMPGDQPLQIRNVALFTEIAGRVCQQAVEVVAA